jgi:hypothetical protein
MQLSVQVPMRNTAALNALLTAQDDPHSSLFHHYLTSDQFTSQFGPLPQTTNRVVAYLTSQGLHVTTITANHAFINVSGSASAVERAFAVTLDTYAFDGRTVFAPLNEPSIPASLAGAVQNIVGLDDVAQYHHRALPKRPQTGGRPPYDPNGCNPLGYGPYPLYTAYDITPLADSSAFNGTGQTIDIVSFDGAYEADITPFDQCFGLPAPTFLPSVSAPNGAYPVNTTPATFMDATEDDMDMDVAHEIAPGAALRFYLGSHENISGSGSDYYVTYYITEVLPVFEQIVQDDNGGGTNPPPNVTSSWGIGCEEMINTGEHAVLSVQLEQYDTTLTQGAAEGIAFFQDTGDSGSDDCNNGTTSIDIAAADPHVVAVGGTNYTAGLDNTRGTEVGWNRSGGGQSTYFPEPFYQRNMPAYYDVPTMRGIPDVAADACSDTQAVGYAVYCTAPNLYGMACPGWEVNGGTSAATPLWAGIAADIDSYLSYYGKDTLGTASALLYQVNLHDYPNAFYDITSGSNDAYSAGSGYDFVTGMGSPNAWRIATDLNAEIETNIESDVVWGQTQSNGDSDLMAEYTRSDAPGWSPPADVTKLINQLDNHNSNSFNLRAAGPPTLISYPTPGDGTEMDVFALANDSRGEELHGFSYLPASGAWSDLGVVATYTNPLPTLNPVALVLNAPGQAATLALFGISSASASFEHLIEYYTFLAGRGAGNPPTFQFRDLTQQTGVTCNHHIAPAAVAYDDSPVVFADCGDKLTEFSDNGTGTYQANTNLGGNTIPNASEAFPGHSLAAMVVPGHPARIETYVANDRNGVSALSENLYDGSAWHAFLLPLASGHVPDQVHAQTVVATTLGGSATVSEVIATDPASTSCFTLPASVQYLYQPQVQTPPPGWYHTVLNGTDDLGITNMQAIVEQSGTVLTEAYKGAYVGSGSAGGEGGGGCTINTSIYEDGSALAPASPQSWFASFLGDPDGDNLGVDPAGTAFPY